MAETKATHLRSVCTRDEYSLLMASGPGSIEALSITDLRRNVASARRLRNKWRGIASRGLRASKEQQAPGSIQHDPRSVEKAVLFARALTRFEARLKRAGPLAGAARIGRRAGSGAVKAAAARATHQDRSVSRVRLNSVRSAFNAADGPPAAKKVTAEVRPKKKRVAAARKHARGRTTATDREQQQLARSSALLSRSRGHILARGGRAQARRDSRG